MKEMKKFTKKKSVVTKLLCLLLSVIMLIPSQTTKVEAAKSSTSKVTVFGYDSYYHFLISEKGKKIVNLGRGYDSISDFYNGVAIVEDYIDDEFVFGLMNSKGKIIVKPQYDSISDFSDGVAVVYNEYTEDKIEYGVINTKGKLVVKLGKYDYISDFSDGCAIVVKDDKYGIINTKGKVIAKVQYDSISYFQTDMQS